MMKCIYCGEELKEGSLYGQNCGKPVRFWRDYNIYINDNLIQFLRKKSQRISGSDPTRIKKREPPRKNIPGKSTVDEKGLWTMWIMCGHTRVVKAKSAKNTVDNPVETVDAFAQFETI